MTENGENIMYRSKPADFPELDNAVPERSVPLPITTEPRDNPASEIGIQRPPQTSSYKCGGCGSLFNTQNDTRNGDILPAESGNNEIPENGNQRPYRTSSYKPGGSEPLVNTQSDTENRAILTAESGKNKVPKKGAQHPYRTSYYRRGGRRPQQSTQIPIQTPSSKRGGCEPLVNTQSDTENGAILTAESGKNKVPKKGAQHPYRTSSYKPGGCEPLVNTQSDTENGAILTAESGKNKVPKKGAQHPYRTSSYKPGGCEPLVNTQSDTENGAILTAESGKNKVPKKGAQHPYRTSYYRRGGRRPQQSTQIPIQTPSSKPGGCEPLVDTQSDTENGAILTAESEKNDVPEKGTQYPHQTPYYRRGGRRPQQSTQIPIQTPSSKPGGCEPLVNTQSDTENGAILTAESGKNDVPEKGTQYPHQTPFYGERRPQQSTQIPNQTPINQRGDCRREQRSQLPQQIPFFPHGNRSEFFSRGNVTGDGVIFFELRYNVSIGITVDGSVRIFDRNKYIVIALTNTAEALAVLHVHGSIYKCEKITDFIGYGTDRIYSKAKIAPRGVYFTKKNCALTYLVDAGGVHTCNERFADLSVDVSLKVFYGTSVYGEAQVQHAIEILQGAKYSQDETGTEHWKINGINICQAPDGFMRANNGFWKLSLSPTNGCVHISCSKIHCTASMDGAPHIFVRQKSNCIDFNGKNLRVRCCGRFVGLHNDNLRIY